MGIARVSPRRGFLSRYGCGQKERDADELVSPTGLWTHVRSEAHQSLTHLARAKEIGRAHV